MTCSSCGHENRAGARFCEACGSPLGSSCEACGAEVRAGARFCEACGAPVAAAGLRESSPTPPAATALPEHLAEKVRAAGASLAGERKQVTVLFADVMNSMELAEQCDPEEWRRIMERFFALLCEGVHRFEGTVDKFTGDGAMVLFGAPIAQEKHAVQACHAALHLGEELDRFSAELRREQGLNFLVRIGLNSGEVVVGSIGEDLAMDYTAIGHTVGLAQRMEALAQPGKAYLTENTAALAEGYFELRDLGQFEVKGVHEPLRVYELAGLGRLRTRFEVSRAHGLSPFVGREEECATLESALARAGEGNAQVVCTVGEAGVGKSRLCYEFAKRCRERGIDVWEGHCMARGESLPLMPLLELLRSYFGITDRDTGQAAREKIAGRMVLLDESLKEELPLLFDLLGVSDAERPEPIDPEARQRRLFAALNRLLVASERPAVVLLIEDLQWIDPGSAAFLENLVDGLPGTRTLVIVNFRPGYQAEWMQRSYCGRLALASLGPRASEELLRGLLGEDPSLDGLAEQIRERTGGNPFFIEELVRGLAESGSLIGERGGYRLARPLDGEGIPATVQPVIAARIDRLGEREKQLLRTAAVIGREFTEPVLRRVAGLPEPELRAALRALLNGELIYEQSLVPEPEYSFKHQLIEEVAYRSQLAEPRARLHGEVARAIEELNPDRLDELAAPISRHLEQAGDHLEAARWGARAAAWAWIADPGEALRHWQRVRELTDSAPDSAEAVEMGTWARISIMNFAWRLGAEEAEIRRAFEEARQLAKRSGDVRALAFGLGMYAATRVNAGEPAAYVDMQLEGLRLAEESGDPAVRVASVATPWALFVTGRLREALEVMEPWWGLWGEDPSLGSGLGVECPYAFCVWLSAVIRTVRGELTVQKAHEEIERALALALEHADVESAGWAHGTQVWLCWFEGDGETALEHANRGVEIAERTGGSFQGGTAYGYRGLAQVVRGEWDEAIAALERSLEILREARAGLLWEPWQLAWLGEAYLGAGQSDRARESAKHAVDLVLEQGARYLELMPQLALVRVLIGTEGTGARSEIEAALARVSELIEEIGARGYEPFLHEQRARLAELSGDTERREHELREAQRLFEAIGATSRAASLAAELAPVAASRG
ncbi:MAG TPA: adenylate/guanylate cyclase domain-containing protein [Solirubrobacterales bacterium]|nr:adenylate/guanylate cyclase domain-containing protein [Solirubrobacterales bacterium]